MRKLLVPVVILLAALALLVWRIWVAFPPSQQVDAIKGFAPYAVLLATVGVFLIKEWLGTARLDVDAALEQPALSEAVTVDGKVLLYIRLRVTNSGPAAARNGEAVIGRLNRKADSGTWEPLPFLPSTLQWTNRGEQTRLASLVPEVPGLVDLAFLHKDEIHFTISPTPFARYHVCQRDRERNYCFLVTVAAENATPKTRHFGTCQRL